ncbi:MAG: glycerol-3-phosphate dehydrogenase/oxidase, partial [Gammaproteobacteria bacterium]
LEREDFGSGTSSKSSKLVHGGVRYLGLGQWGLVREALRERALLLDNAPAIVEPLRFLVPAGNPFELALFRVGLKCYDWLGRGRATRPSARVPLDDLPSLAPGLKLDGLSGAIAYDDARFDDCRLLLAVLRAARERGALTLNYTEVRALTRGKGRIDGVVVADLHHGREYEVRAKVVINAAGPYADGVRALDDPAAVASLTPSQGAHVVVDRSFLGGAHAIVFPRTDDGRIMFAIPWHGHVLLGTTDTPMPTAPAAPRALASEVDDILEVADTFLAGTPTRAHVRSVFAGLRPLAGSPDGASTASRSREHALDVSAGGLVSVSGGKWTTYRVIAAQAVDLACRTAGIAAPPSSTADIALAPLAAGAEADGWGCGAALGAIVDEDPALAEPLHEALPYTGAHFVHAARHELAVTVADALAYRTRALFIDARAAAEIAPRVAALLGAELGQDAAWIEQESAAAEAAAESFLLTPIRARGTPG